MRSPAGTTVATTTNADRATLHLSEYTTGAFAGGSHSGLTEMLHTIAWPTECVVNAAQRSRSERVNASASVTA